MAEVQGSCDPAFDSVRDVLQQRLAEGNEVDASQTESKQWGKDTITGVWSTTKIVTSLAALLLVSRGLLDINENVATYWPEFAANGKENIKVSQILSHSSGVMTVERQLTPEEMENREASVLKLAEELQDLHKTAARLAEQPPWYVPGSQSAYTASIYGHLVGELVRRITGKSLSQFITEEITTPLGADFQLGLPEEEWARTADIIPFPLNKMVPLTAVDPTSILGRVLQGSLVYPTIPNKPVFRKSENGAMGGFSNARALARIGSLVSLDGTVDGKQYLTPQTLDEMMTERMRGFDPCLNGKIRFGLGLGLPWSESIAPFIPEEDGICFWSGYGGSIVIMDRRRRTTISYIMNKLELRLSGNSNLDAYLPEIYKSLERYTIS
ncbi:beta-lactamase [Penicillium frequentans]|uniref:Beta-lactamase n=1 Tax=Penicillium frequentans TaxID=3151616 RepID=A0AAD6CWV8_9EURO|nr:beta-lactamase [Penicillium glabrum]